MSASHQRFEKPKISLPRPSSNLAINPIILSTIIIALIAWIVAFAGSIATSSSITLFPKFTWWGLVFQFFIVIIIPILYLTHIIHFYRFFLLCCLSIAFVYTSNSVNNLIYYSGSSSSAASAGFIICSISNLVWIFYLGSEPDTPIISYINAFGNTNITRKRISSMNNNNNYSYNRNTNPSTFNLNANKSGNLDASSPNNNTSSNPFERPTTVFAGLENPSTNQLNEVSDDNYSTFTPDDSYPIVVKGLYDYNASPDDVNELSFSKGEIFKVKNTVGNWWQGKNNNGEIGMCPSNYLEIVN